MDNGKPYSMSFSSIGICFKKSLEITSTDLDLGGWNLVKQLIEEKDLSATFQRYRLKGASLWEM